MSQPIEAVVELVHQVLEGGPGSGELRRFADVSIVTSRPEPQRSGFYPEDRYLVTPHVAEVGWLFDELADAFREANGYGMWKEELFGRLGNAGTWYLAHQPNADSRDLCLAILCEAFDCADEVEATGGLQAFMVAAGNQIVDDERPPRNPPRPSTPKETTAYLLARLGER